MDPRRVPTSGPRDESGVRSNVHLPHLQRSTLVGLAAALAVVVAACAPTPPSLGAPPAAAVTADESDVQYGPYPEQLLDVFRTTATTRRGTIVFVHGGGFTSGEKEVLTAGTFGALLAQLDRGFDIVAIDYRLAPEHPFPAAFDDVGLAVAWVRANGDAHGLDTREVALFGHSAGGSLAAMVGTSPGWSTEFGPLPRVERWVSMAGMSSFAAGGTLADYPGDWGLTTVDARVAASPITTIDRSDPPGYLIHGDRDGFVADWHSVVLDAYGRSLGADLRLDHITRGTSDCRGHFGLCGADLSGLESFLG